MHYNPNELIVLTVVYDKMPGYRRRYVIQLSNASWLRGKDGNVRRFETRKAAQKMADKISSLANKCLTKSEESITQ